MPCRSDHLEATEREIYLSRVLCHHDELDGKPDRAVMDARITDARLDLFDKATSQVDVGNFNDPSLYHLAVRVTREPCQQEET